MALIPSNVPLKLGGLDSKTDARHVVPGDLVEARNVIFDGWPRIAKRPGHQLLAKAASGAQCASYKNQLLLGTGAEAMGYAPGGVRP